MKMAAFKRVSDGKFWLGKISSGDKQASYGDHPMRMYPYEPELLAAMVVRHGLQNHTVEVYSLISYGSYTLDIRLQPNGNAT
jgi:hypothetical protein